MKKTKTSLDRRDFLRASAGTVASASMMSNLFVERALAMAPGDKRVIIWWMPEGCAQQAFWPANTGTLDINMNANINGQNLPGNNRSIRGYINQRSAGYSLQPLQKHINDISLYSGFQNRGANAGQPHTKVMQNCLTGGTPAGGSFDQIMGANMKGGLRDAIYMPMWGHHVLNRGANNGVLSPARKIGGGTFGSGNWNPMETYVDLFRNGVPAPTGGGNTGGAAYNADYARVLALKSAEAQLEAVKCQGGAEAQHKLEVLLQSYGKLEEDAQRSWDLANAGANNGGGADVRFNVPNGWTNTAGNRTDKSKYWNQVDKFEQLMDISINTTVAALALGRTRVSLMQFSSSATDKGPISKHHYKTLGIQGLEGGDVNDHTMGHDHNPTKRRNQARIFRWYYSKLAELIDKLKATPDGTETLFDNTMIITATEYSMYNHRTHDMPYIVAGGSNINIRKGVYQNVSNGNNFRHHADFFLGAARALDVNLNKFGQSSNAFVL